MFPYIETSQLICSENQLTGFYMMGTLAVKGLSNLDNSEAVAQSYSAKNVKNFTKLIEKHLCAGGSF